MTTNPLILTSHFEKLRAFLAALVLYLAFCSPANLLAACSTPAGGLVSWWQGEGSGGDSQFLNNGISTTAYSTGMAGSAFSFNGSTTQQVALSGSQTLDVGTGPGFTVEAWIKPTDVGAGRVILEWQGNYGVHFWIGHPSNLKGYIFANLVDTSGEFHVVDAPGGTIQSNVWQHVALTYDKASGYARLYRNGQRIAETLLGTFTPRTSGGAFIGSREGNQYPYAGLIDELALYSRSLDEAEIQQIFLAGAEGKCQVPIAPWVLENSISRSLYAGDAATMSIKAAGTPPLTYRWFHDGQEVASGTNNSVRLDPVKFDDSGLWSVQVFNGAGNAEAYGYVTVTPAPPCTRSAAGLVALWRGDGGADDDLGPNPMRLINGVGFAQGKVRDAFAFNGINQYSEVADAPVLNPRTALTLACWVNLSDYNGGPVFLASKDDGYTPQFGLTMVNVGGMPTPQATIRVPTGYVNLTGKQYIPLYNWTHVAMTYDGSTLRLYLNGQEDSSITAAGTLVRSTQPIRVGGNANGARLAGLLDELELHARALAPQEIADIYTAGEGGRCPGLVPPCLVSVPTNLAATLRSSTNLVVVAGGSSPWFYQWLFNGDAVPGATNSVLSLTNVQFSNGGSYAVTVSNALGTVTSPDAVLSLLYPPAAIRITGTNVPSGTALSIPIAMVANGNEYAVGLSFSFDPARLVYLGVTGAPAGAALHPNITAISSGRLGVSVWMPPGTTFPAGTQTVFQVRFWAPAVASSSLTPLVVLDSPFPRQVLDTQLGSLPGTFASASITLQPVSGFEGDISPRSTVDKSLGLADWLQGGRYAARLDYPSNTVELQRVDCAPAPTFGDGCITVSDWVQTGRYAMGLDWAAPVGGPVFEVFPGPAAVSATRLLSAGAALLVPNQNCTIPVVMSAQGDENAVAFSLVFDPVQVRYTGTVLGSHAAGAALQVNTNKVAQGRIGVAIALAPGLAFSPGECDLVRFTFAGLTSGETLAPQFGDDPVFPEISSVEAAPLPLGYRTGILPAVPSLSIGRSALQAVLRWPASAWDYTLQVRSVLNDGQVWTNAPGENATNGHEIIHSLPLESGARYYRLIK